MFEGKTEFSHLPTLQQLEPTIALMIDHTYYLACKRFNPKATLRLEMC
jgi:hypothetical protein